MNRPFLACEGKKVANPRQHITNGRMARVKSLKTSPFPNSGRGRSFHLTLVKLPTLHAAYRTPSRGINNSNNSTSRRVQRRGVLACLENLKRRSIRTLFLAFFSSLLAVSYSNFMKPDGCLHCYHHPVLPTVASFYLDSKISPLLW